MLLQFVHRLLDLVVNIAHATRAGPHRHIIDDVFADRVEVFLHVLARTATRRLEAALNVVQIFQTLDANLYFRILTLELPRAFCVGHAFGGWLARHTGPEALPATAVALLACCTAAPTQLLQLRGRAQIHGGHFSCLQQEIWDLLG